MPATSTITTKGQVTIPAQIRDDLGLQPKQKVLFSHIAGKVYLEPAKNFLDFAGSLKSKKPFDIRAMRKSAQKHVVEHYLRSLKNGKNN